MASFDNPDPLASMWQELRQYGIDNPAEADEEQSLISDLAAKGMSGLQYVGESLDKPGQALRGLLAGKPAELLNLIPFSDALGLTSSEGLFGRHGMNVTDDEDNVTGRDLLEQWGALDQNEEGLDWGDASGLGAEIILDPYTYMTGGMTALTKLGKAFKAAGLIPDIAVQAKRAGLATKGAATARNTLTGQHVLDAITDPVAKSDAIKALLNAKYKGQSAGKTLDDIPVEELNQPLGGLFNLRVPFQESLGIGPLTIHAEGLSKLLDTAAGNIKYGTKFARGFNSLFDAGHSKGGGESRFAQEFAIPNERLRRQEVADPLNAITAELKGRIARGGEAAYTREAELPPQWVDDPLAPPGVSVKIQADTHGPAQGGDLNQKVYRAAEGVGPDPTKIRPVNQKYSEAQQRALERAGLPFSKLYDPTIDYAARHKVWEEGTGDAGLPAAANLLQLRSDLSRGIPGGTARVIDINKALADAVEQSKLAQLGGMQPADMIADILRGRDPGLPTYSTLEGRQAEELLHQPVTSRTPAEIGVSRKALPSEEFDAYRKTVRTPAEQAALEAAVESGTGLDRYDALAEWSLRHDPKTLAAGLYTDLPSAQQLNTRATADAAGRAMAFQDALQQDLAKAYPGAETVPIEEAARVLHLDKDVFRSPTPKELLSGTARSFPAIPKQLLQELLAPKLAAKPTGVLGSILDTVKNVTQFNKSWMTGALTNPSFPVRNRVSGASENTYLGDIGPLAALQGLLRSGADIATLGLTDIFKSPAQLIARGKDIPGAAAIPALQQKAAQMGRTIANDTDATNFLRERFAAAGGSMGGQHTADNILENLTGEGQFLGGFAGPTGADAFSPGKVAKEALGIKDQLTSWQGLKDLFLGAQGTDLLNKGVARPEHTSAILQSGKTLNDYVEAQNRFGPWYEMVKEGVADSEAMRRVNRANVNYHASEYTPTENNLLTQLIPFYKFSKNSALTHANELATKPGGALSHLLQTTGQLNDEHEIVPEHVKEKLSIPVDKLPFGLDKLLASGDPETKRYLTGLGLAYEDPLTWVTGAPGGMPFNLETIQEGLGRLNPLLKGAGENITGRSFFQRDETGSGRLLKEQDPAAGRLLANLTEMLSGNELTDIERKMLVKKLSPYQLGESLLGNSPLSRILATGKNLTDQRPNTRLKALLNTATGARLADVTASQRDSVVKGLLNELTGEDPLAETRSTTYIPKRYAPYLTEQTAKNQQVRKLLERIINQNQKQRAAEQQDPLAALLGL